LKIKNILHYLPDSKSEMTSREAYESRICAIAPIKKQPAGNDSQTIYYGLSTDFTQQTDAKFILSDKPVSLQYGKECNFILTHGHSNAVSGIRFCTGRNSCCNGPVLLRC